MGFRWSEVRKGVYFDDYEKKDTVQYQEEVFIPQWFELARRMPEWKEDGTFIPP